MKLLLTLLLFVGTAFAHEGHDHDKPVSIKAPKGGLIKTLEETYVEVLENNGTVNVYLYDKEFKPKSTKGFKLSAKAKLPRKDDELKIEFKPTENGYTTKFQPNSHRYTLVISIVDPATGHNDKLNYIIEPKR